MQGHYPLPLQLADSSIFASSAFLHTSHDILLGIGGRALSTPSPGGGTPSKPIFLLSRDFLPLFFCLICSICQEITSHFFLFNFFLLFVSCFYTLNPLLIFLFKVFFFLVLLFLHLRAFPNSSFDIELWSRLDRDKEVWRKKGIGDCSLFFFFIILFPS